jgi:hypothetical protein
VALDGVDGVLTTRRNKAASAAEKGTESDTVEVDELDEEPFHLGRIISRFKEGALWGICAKLASLFDKLTAGKRRG